MRHLQDRVVLVTGAGRGFGRLLVQGSTARGAKAVTIDVDGAAAAETVAGATGDAHAVRADVTVPGDPRAAVAAAIEAFGHVDVRINDRRVHAASVTVVRPTGAVGTGLGGTVVNRDAIFGIVGTTRDAYGASIATWAAGVLDDAARDRDEMSYWSITRPP